MQQEYVGRRSPFGVFFLVWLLAAPLAGAGMAQAAPAAGGIAQGPQGEATLIGTVTGPHGEVLSGASATLTNAVSGQVQARASDTNGFLTFTVPPGQYALAVTAPGFVRWTSGTITVQAGDYRELTGIVLPMQTAVDTVRVTANERELATEQVDREEKQRILGVVPNFYVSYVPHAAPLSAGQKFQLAWKSSIDPFTFAIAGVQAGVEQANDDYPGYGEGAAGYAKRYGAAYADSFSGAMIGGAVLPALLHQDPRYYYKGTGSIASRTLYAISMVAICRGDNGRWQPNYSFVLGNLASGAISNLYYPASDRNGAGVTVDNALIDTALGAVNALLEEFVLKRLTHGAAQSAAGH